MLETLGEDGDGLVGVVEIGSLALIEATELLQHFGVVRVGVQDPVVGVFGEVELCASEPSFKLVRARRTSCCCS